MSLRRTVDIGAAGGAGCCTAAGSACGAGGASTACGCWARTPAAASSAITPETVSNIRIGRPSEDLVEDADEPSGAQVVLHQPAAEVPDAHLADGSRRHDVSGVEVCGPHHTGQHEHLPIAIDLDLADALDDEVAVRQHLPDTRRQHRRERACA